MFGDLKKLKNSFFFFQNPKGKFAFVTHFWEHLCTVEFNWATAGATDVWSEQGFAACLEILTLCVIVCFLSFICIYIS